MKNLHICTCCCCCLYWRPSTCTPNYRRRKAIRKFGDPILMAQLMPDVSKYRPDVKFWLVFAAIGLFTVLLARPQFGSKLETVKSPGSGSDDCVGYIQFHAGTRRTAKPLAEGKTAGGAVGR